MAFHQASLIMRLRAATAIVVPYNDDSILDLRLIDTNTATPVRELPYIGGFKYSYIWQRMLFKIKVQRALNQFRTDIVTYGTSYELTDLHTHYKPNLKQLLNLKLQRQEEFRRLASTRHVASEWYILTPESLVRRTWDFLMAALLFYTGAVLPVRVAFYEIVFFDTWAWLDVVVDMMFVGDILMNCLFTYYTSAGMLETRMKLIVNRYLKSWFFLDLCSCFPFTLLEYSVQGTLISQVRLLKLVRLGRLYKIMKYLKPEGVDEADTWINRIRERLRSQWRKRYTRALQGRPIHAVLVHSCSLGRVRLVF